jgi:hypothetical protein
MQTCMLLENFRASGMIPHEFCDVVDFSVYQNPRIALFIVFLNLFKGDFLGILIIALGLHTKQGNMFRDTQILEQS